MANRRRTGLDRQSSLLPIVIGAIAVAAVLGLIGGVVWGLASSGKPSQSPTPLPTQSALPTTPSASPTLTSPTPSASPTLTTASATPTPTASGIPPAPSADQLNSNNWSLNQYQYVGAGTFKMTAKIANLATKPRHGDFTVYVYQGGRYVGTLTASLPQQLPTGTGPGTAVTFTSSDHYVSGPKVIIFIANP